MGNQDATNSTNSGSAEAKKFGTYQIIEAVMIITALVIGIIGIVRITDIYRVIIYAGQSLVCFFIFLFGVLRYKDSDGKLLKIVIISYALIEALRVSLLSVIGVHFVVGVIAKFILASLACTCVLMAERMNNESGKKTAIGVLVLEILLYVIFVAGFKGVMLGRINRFLPLMGVLIAGTIALIHKENVKE